MKIIAASLPALLGSRLSLSAIRTRIQTPLPWNRHHLPHPKTRRIRRLQVASSLCASCTPNQPCLPHPFDGIPRVRAQHLCGTQLAQMTNRAPPFCTPTDCTPHRRIAPHQSHQPPPPSCPGRPLPCPAFHLGLHHSILPPNISCLPRSATYHAHLQDIGAMATFMRL
jgi:hypothetical protein